MKYELTRSFFFFRYLTQLNSFDLSSYSFFGQYRVTFFGVAPEYSFNGTTCSDLKLTEVSVDFEVPGVVATICGTMVIPEGLQIFETPNLTTVIGYKTDNNVNCPQTSGNKTFGINYWSGWRAWYQINGNNVPMDYAASYFTQEGVLSNSYCLSGQPYECDLSVWAALDNANGFIAQTGTDGTVSGAVTYDGWYEYYPAPPYLCPQTPLPTDSMQAIAENGYSWGGASNQYALYLIDNSGNGWVCSAPTDTYTGTITTLAETILEIPTIGSYFAFLPTFTSVTSTYNIEGYYYQGSSTYTNYYSSWTNGWYSPAIMSNYCNGNLLDTILLGPIGSNGGFTSTYSSSCGT